MSQTHYFHCKHLLYCSLFHFSGAACVFHICVRVRRDSGIWESLLLPLIMNVALILIHTEAFYVNSCQKWSNKTGLAHSWNPWGKCAGKLWVNYLSQQRKFTFPPVTSGRIIVLAVCHDELINVQQQEGECWLQLSWRLVIGLQKT